MGYFRVCRVLAHWGTSLTEADSQVSRNLILFSTVTKSGIAIPYPIISLHAIQRLHLPPQSPDSTQTSPEVQGLYTQLVLPSSSTAAAADEEPETLEFTLIPSSSTTAPSPSEAPAAPQPISSEAEAPSDTPSEPQSPVQALFAAVSACAALHPDPASSEDGEVEPGGMPGAGGWITTENAEQFFDADGQFIGGSGALGPGAGTVRGWEAVEDVEHEEGEEVGEDVEEDAAEAGGLNHADTAEETKWRRTE